MNIIKTAVNNAPAVGQTIHTNAIKTKIIIREQQVLQFPKQLIFLFSLLLAFIVIINKLVRNKLLASSGLFFQTFNVLIFCLSTR
jgi:hypothetical protein